MITKQDLTTLVDLCHYLPLVLFYHYANPLIEGYRILVCILIGDKKDE